MVGGLSCLQVGNKLFHCTYIELWGRGAASGVNKSILQKTAGTGGMIHYGYAHRKLILPVQYSKSDCACACDDPLPHFPLVSTGPPQLFVTISLDDFVSPNLAG